MKYMALYGRFECEAAEELNHLRRRVQRYRAVLRRCAERSRREREMRVAAESAAREKDRTMAAVCHDLRTPLNAMMTWAQFAAAVPDRRDKVREALTRIEVNGRSQAMLINDILDLAKSANGTLRIKRTPVDLKVIVAAALAVVESAAAAKDIALEFRSAADPVTVLGDPVRLQRVVWNLLTNALKFTSHRGRVTVDLQREGPNAVLRITDTGCGISPHLLPRIFDRFEQGASDRGGVGLGLPIVHRLVEKHGGAVTAHSAGESLGSVFTVSLPLSDTTACDDAPEARSASPPSSGAGK